MLNYVLCKTCEHISLRVKCLRLKLSLCDRLPVCHLVETASFLCLFKTWFLDSQSLARMCWRTSAVSERPIWSVKWGHKWLQPPLRKEKIVCSTGKMQVCPPTHTSVTRAKATLNKRDYKERTRIGNPVRDK